MCSSKSRCSDCFILDMHLNNEKATWSWFGLIQKSFWGQAHLCSLDISSQLHSLSFTTFMFCSPEVTSLKATTADDLRLPLKHGRQPFCTIPDISLNMHTQFFLIFSFWIHTIIIFTLQILHCVCCCFLAWYYKTVSISPPH